LLDARSQAISEIGVQLLAVTPQPTEHRADLPD
jgi:hypothetical protein